MPGTLGGQVLDEVRLVHHHRAEAQRRGPGEVAVEDLVVDHEDVRERVHVLPVAVDDGDAAVRGPQGHLAGPVDLDDVRHHGEHRVRVRHRGCDERLCRLPQSGLVREQEGTVAAADRLEDPRLVVHEVLAGRGELVGAQRLRQRHRRRRAARSLLERAVEGVHQVPPEELATGTHLLAGTEVRGEERIGTRPGQDRRRHHLPLGQLRRDQRGLMARSLDLLGPHLDARLLEPLPAQLPSGETGRDVLAEEVQEAGVARCGVGEDVADPLDALQQLLAGRFAERGILLDPGTLRTHEQGDDLEPGAVLGSDPAPGRLALHVPHMAREDGDEWCAFVGRGTRAGTRSGTPVRGRHVPPGCRGSTMWRRNSSAGCQTWRWREHDRE